MIEVSKGDGMSKHTANQTPGPQEEARQRPTRARRPRLRALLAAGAVAVPTLLTAGVASASTAPIPASQECSLTDFTQVNILPSPHDPHEQRLIVSGILPAGTTVSLVPLVYIRQPEFWGYEVTACPSTSPS